MIRKIAGENAEPLTFMFNLSLAYGVCPSGWKNALVKALHKKDSKSDFINNRPISVTSIFSRVMAKLIVERIQKFFDDNSLWSPAQHGLRKRRSCNSQLLEVIADFQGFADLGIPFDCVYTDISKAFDKVSIPLLLQ